MLAVGGQYICGISADGFVFCWGNDDYGQVSDTPTDRFTFIDAGPYRTCGIRIDGSIVCWGKDGSDQSDTGNIG